MRFLIIVFIGGGMGSVGRYLINKWFSGFYSGSFPISTLVINLAGCFLIGVFLTLPKSQLPDQWKLFLASGFCGGFTTFSSFGYENNILLGNKEYLHAILYTSLSVGLGLLATFLGIILVRNLYKI